MSLDIYDVHSGDEVKFTGKNVSKGSIRWGSHTDPDSILEAGNYYTVEEVEIHS